MIREDGWEKLSQKSKQYVYDAILCVKMRKKIRVYIFICLYMPKTVMDGNLRNQEQSFLWWGWGRVRMGEVGPKTEKKTFHCTAFILSGFWTTWMYYLFKKLNKISIFKKPCDSVQIKRCWKSPIFSGMANLGNHRQHILGGRPGVRLSGFTFESHSLECVTTDKWLSLLPCFLMDKTSDCAHLLCCCDDEMILAQSLIQSQPLLAVMTIGRNNLRPLTDFLPSPQIIIKSSSQKRKYLKGEKNKKKRW